MSLLPVMACLPFAAALLLAFVSNDRRRLAAWIAGAASLAGCALLAWFAPALFSGSIPAWSIAWLPGLEVAFGFRETDAGDPLPQRGDDRSGGAPREPQAVSVVLGPHGVAGSPQLMGVMLDRSQYRPGHQSSLYSVFIMCAAI